MGATLKILHIWNTAGVASTIAKFMDRLYSTESMILMRALKDQFKLTYYGGPSINLGSKHFIIHAIIEARKYDIIHVHYYDRIIPFIKGIYNNKKVIMHYHGDDIRKKWEEKRERWMRTNAIIISTADLLDGAPFGVIYIPNPIDTELFQPMLEQRRFNTALHITYSRYQNDKDLELVKEWADKERVKLTVINRDESPVPFLEMPRLLNRFEFFVDRFTIPSLSKTALEALACGIKVVAWNGEIVEKLPEDNKPEIVVQRVYNLYKKILDN